VFGDELHVHLQAFSRRVLLRRPPHAFPGALGKRIAFKELQDRRGRDIDVVGGTDSTEARHSRDRGGSYTRGRRPRGEFDSGSCWGDPGDQLTLDSPGLEPSLPDVERRSGDPEISAGRRDILRRGVMGEDPSPLLDPPSPIEGLGAISSHPDLHELVRN
jgi:hypothetical protein